MGEILASSNNQQWQTTETNKQLTEYLKHNSRHPRKTIPAEKIAEVHERIVKRISLETDLPDELRGLISVADYLEPTVAIKRFDCSVGSITDVVPVKEMPYIAKIIKDDLGYFLGLYITSAAFSPTKREIYVRRDLRDTLYSAVYKTAIGKMDHLQGAVLAHEALHAHQIPPRVKMSRIEEAKRAVKLIQENPGISNRDVLARLGRLVDRSVDQTIVTEAHSYLIVYACGAYSHQAEQWKKNRTRSNPSKNIQEPIFDEIKISNYDNDGFARLDDLFVDIINKYLPRQFAQDKNMLNRIRTAYKQLTILKELGKTHIEIAHLIRNNYQNAYKQAWSEKHGYSFLHKEITKSAQGKGLSLEKTIELVEVAEEKKRQRGRTVKKIALEEFYQAVRSVEESRLQR